MRSILAQAVESRSSQVSYDSGSELNSLIETLRRTDSRLEELTGGTVDAVTDSAGKTHLLRHAQERLRKLELAKQNTILNALPEMIAVLDPLGVISSVNDAWKRAVQSQGLAGLSQTIGKNYLEVCENAQGYQSSEAHTVARGIRHLLEGREKSFSIEYSCHSGEEQQWFALTASVRADNLLSGVIIMHRDITERTLREHSSKRFRSVMDTSSEAILLLRSRPLRFIDANWTACHMLGYSRAELLETDPAFILDASADLVKRGWDWINAKTRIAESFETTLRRKDGSTVEVEARQQAEEYESELIVVWVLHDLSPHRKSEAAVAENRQRLALATAAAHLGIWDWKLLTDEMVCDERMYALYGTVQTPGISHVETWKRGIHPDDRAMVDAAIKRAVAGPEDFDCEFRVVWPEGQVRYLEAHAFVQRAEDGSPIRMVGVNRDITDRKTAAIKISRLNRVTSVLSKINALTVRVRNRKELFEEASRIAVRDGGFAVALIGNIGALENFVMNSSKDLDVAAVEELKSNLEDPRYIQQTLFALASREKKSVVSNSALTDERVLLRPQYKKLGIQSLAAFPIIVAGEAIACVALFSREVDFFSDDEKTLLDQLASELAVAIDYIAKVERLSFLAYYDSLTGLANRILFIERCGKLILGSSERIKQIALVLIDIDRFRNINEVLGRVAGDSLLKEVGLRLSRSCRSAWHVARVGSNVFAVVISSDGTLDLSSENLLDISSQFERPFVIEGTEVTSSAKFGVALFPLHATSAEHLFKNAEAALKYAKATHRRNAIFSEEFALRIRSQHDLEQELRIALKSAQFVAYYQPRVDMISGEVVGAEALIRWQHPRRGLIFPKDFIQVAEDTGLIVELGAWMISAVTEQQAAWSRAGISTVPVAVNLSAPQFEHGNILKTIADALAASGIPGDRLEVELTESAIVNDPDAASSTLNGLRQLGVNLALDDFGTGYSSLAHLRRFPFQSVKIDHSFVRNITEKPDDAAIAQAIIAMTHRMHKKVVAEGVETQGQFNFLRAQGCDEMQGFLFSPAVNAEAFAHLLRFGKRLAAPEIRLSSHTLLIVDDERSICSAITRSLRGDGYRIFTASSGAEALRLLALHSVQVIISDQRMPGMSGTEFLDMVKQLYPRTVRIILSGYTDLQVVTDAVNRGAVFKFLTKPWDDQALREQVREAFRHSADATDRQDSRAS